MATSKFFDNPGSPQSALDYLFDEKHKPELMRGNPQNFLDLANSLDFKNQYTSGVVRAVEDLSDEQMKFIMDEYTKFLTEGLNQPPEVLWVKHFEHGETELHFVVPNVDLESGRAFQPYAHNRDLARRDALDNIINAKYDLKDPDDPANTRFTASDKEYLKTSKDRKGLAQAVDKAIEDSLVKTIQAGGVYGRAEVVADLKSLGFKVSERGKNISIKNDAMQKPMRLKGAFYEPAAKFDQTSFRTIEQNSESYRASREQRLAENEQEYQRLVGERVKQVERRYSKRWQAAPQKRVANANRAVSSDHSTSPNIVLVGKSDSRENKRVVDNSVPDQQLQQSIKFENQEIQQRIIFGFERNGARLQIRGGLQNRVIDCFYRNKKIGQVIDKGSSLIAQGFKSQKATAFNLMQQAKNKGWTGVQTDSKDPVFLKHLYEQAKFKGIELTAKNKQQEEIFKELKDNDRVREDAVRTVKKIRERTGNYQERKRPIAEKSANFKQQIKRFDQAYGAVKMRRDEELERFKTDINLVEYAQSLGFEVVTKESTKKSVKMKNGSETIIISTDQDGHGIFFNANTNASGSIIDFVQSEKNMNLGQVRKELRPWIGRDANARTEREHYTPKPKASSKNEQLVLNEWAKTEPLLTHPYLTARGINENTQSNPKFQGRFRIDARKNVIFPHLRNGEVVGFEKKNNGFTGFSSGGEKALWYSNDLMKSEKIVVVESAIDAMSFEQLHGAKQNYGYISIGGQPNAQQIEMLNKLDKSKLIIATDHDQGGEQIRKQIDPLSQCERITPKTKDWNDDLKQLLQQQQEQQYSHSMSMR